MGTDDVLVVFAVLLSAPCFLFCVYFLYECFVFVLLCVFGRKRSGFIQKFNWTIRDGLTTLWCCDRGKWRPAESQRPQLWHILFRPLGPLPTGTYGKYEFHDGDDPGRHPNKCDYCCRRTGIHLTRIEMSAAASNKKTESDKVQLKICSFLCCVRADLATLTKDRVCDCLFMLLASLGYGACGFTWCFLLWFISSQVGGGAQPFSEYFSWSAGTAGVLSLLCLVCNCGYVRYERFPTRFFSNVRTTYVPGAEVGDDKGIELTDICASIEGPIDDGDY